MSLKKIITVSSMLISCFATFLLTQNSVVKANTFSNVTTAQRNYTQNKQDLNNVDRYIAVENNKFTILPSAYQNLNSNQISEIQEYINTANQIVKNYNAIIDVKTKKATISPYQDRSYGKNAIEIHWNYARIYLDAGQAKALATAAISGGSTALGGFFANIGGAAAGAAIGGYLSSVVGDNIKSGIWVDYNYFLGSINRFGWQ
ncbi:putative membrane protein [Lactobacillus colini]|uniref:Membrane protein n=1 Tax=Lactobacillus colini TaxID=1819254 RepID=A0ABS4MCX8_9LACO|nr:hypothetical protein [Lactobacillus colini]MBP2057463.1 putative membrane protein [Lactobacillus colini]